MSQVLAVVNTCGLPTYKLPPIPTPPRTCKAPVVVEVDCVVPKITSLLVTVELPPTTKLPPIPTPPNGTVRAPVAVVPACVAL